MNKNSNIKILIISLIISIMMLSGCIENKSVTDNMPTSNITVTYPISAPTLTPESESTEPQITAKPVMRFTIKKGDDRTVSVICPDGTTISHNYTVGNEYICPVNKTVVRAQTHIAIIKKGVVLVPLSSIIRELRPLGLYDTSTAEIHTKPVTGSPRWSGTRISTYYLNKDNVSATWSERSSNIINVSGQVRKLSSEPFKEKAMYVTYYDDGPRYRDFYEGGGRYDSTVTFVPLKDFVQPFGYEIKQTGDIVIVFSNLKLNKDN